jgi:hypothetical protein
MQDWPRVLTIDLKLLHDSVHHVQQEMDRYIIAVLGFSLHRDALLSRP